MIKNYLLTGATSGLGRATALRLAATKNAALTVLVRRPQAAKSLQDELIRAGAKSVELLELDLESMAACQRFVHDFVHASKARAPFNAVLFNAGVQSVGKLIYTQEGLERSFAVNHLAHHVLLRGLTTMLAKDAVVVWTASGTHDPSERTARMFGFRGAAPVLPLAMSRGEYGVSADSAQAARFAYATSKLCNIVSAIHEAGRADRDEYSSRNYYSYDPGLMPGTGLAREQPAAARWAWNVLMPRLVRLIPGASTPEASARTLAALLTGNGRRPANGAYVECRGQLRVPALPKDANWPRLLMEFSDQWQVAAQAVAVP